MLRIRGPLDGDRLERAIRATCARHEARRTGFRPTRDGAFIRYVEARPRVSLERLALPGASEADVRETVRTFVYSPRGFSPDLLNRFILIERGPQDFTFGFALHHAVGDGETFTSFAQEVFDRYNGRDDFPPATQYREVWDWDWRGSERYRADEAYWREQLRELGPTAGLAEDWSGPAPISSDSVRVLVPADLMARIRAAARAIDVSPFVFWCGIYFVYLSRATDEPEVCTSFQSSGRRTVAGSEGVHGVFSNALLLRAAVDERAGFDSLCRELRLRVREAVSHELVPYHHVSRLTGVRSRFAINSFPESPPLSSPGLEIEPADVSLTQDDFDLNLRMIPRGEALELVAFYRGSGFTAARIAQACEQLLALAEGFSAGPEQAIEAVRSPGPAAPAARKPVRSKPALIHTAFLKQAKARPDAIAMSDGERQVTYCELERKTAAMAQAFARAGVGPGDRVGLVAERSAALVETMLAVARTGAAFVVLDAAYPKPRLAELLEVASPKALVPAGGEACRKLAHDLAAAAHLGVLSAEPSEPQEIDAAGLDMADPSDPAYFLFTSGTTGRPKCVGCSHRPLATFVDWQVRTFGLGPDDRFTLLSGLAHDPVLRDIFTPLSVGATILVPAPAVIRTPGALAHWVAEAKPSVTHLTPAMGSLLADRAAPGGGGSLRWVFWGGDQLHAASVESLRRFAPGARQVNFYGCTETPQAVSCFELDGAFDWKHAPIGRGAGAARLLIMDRSGREKGPGELGEIVVRSTEPSLGYLADGRLKPLPNRRRDRDGVELYWTGDLGLTLPSGDVFVVGRRDDQIKVRGYRVDLSEVLSAVVAQPGVGSAAVVAGGGPGEAQIAAFVSGEGLSGSGLRSALAACLPDFMLPTSIEVLPKLPLLPSGKVDRAALQARLAAPQSKRVEEPESETEAALVSAWTDALPNRTIGRRSSFAELGGDSLSYVQVYLATEEVIGSVPTGWQYLPLAELARAKTVRKRFWTTVDTPILIRAISIVLVVSGHFGLIAYGGGAVAGLMIVSGFLLGGLQLREAFAKRQGDPILRSIVNVLVPTVLVSAWIAWIRWRGGDFEPYLFTLTADFQDYRFLSTQQSFEGYLWYVHCLLHMMIFLYLVVLGLQRWKGFRWELRPALLGLFVLGCAGRFLLPVLADPDFFQVGAAETSRTLYLPTTHLPTIMLGALVATASTRRQRLQTLLLLVAYGAGTAWLYGLHRGLILIAAGGLLLAVPRVSLPRPLVRVIFPVSGASLFIYLCQYVFAMELKHVFLPRTPFNEVAAAVIGGGALWFAWTRARALLGRVDFRAALSRLRLSGGPVRDAIEF